MVLHAAFLSAAAASNLTNTPPAAAARLPEPPSLPSSIERVFRVQLALARLGFSGGSIDGVLGPKTANAIRGYEISQGLPVTGRLEAVIDRLVLDMPPYRYYPITAEDVARLRPVGATWLAKSQQDKLEYETLLELVAEKHWASPTFTRRINPSVDWDNLQAGMTVLGLNTASPVYPGKAAFIRINLAERVLQAWGDRTNLLAQFPCSIGQDVFRSPVGEVQVDVLIPNPNYTFDPRIFPESEEGRQLGRKLILPPGPNNPVGTVWIGLSRPGYGIHGTPKPEQIGRAESHGCIRLSNWNAELLLQLCWVSMPVEILAGE